jgi:eukaryotic-like serine/threonine-protein kinase
VVGDERTLSGGDTPGPSHPELELPPRAGPSKRTFTRGDSIGRYLVLRSIGTGSTGAVYASWDPELDRRLAVKLLHPSEGERDDDRRAALLREAKALARLDHPNVISIHDVGEHDGRVFIAMDFIDGETLEKWQARLRPPWQRVLSTYVQAGRGLAAVHAVGIVHRDFKPQNAMVDARGRVRIVDFGLAASAGAELATRELRAGTPAYMAAELHTEGIAGHAADQFAFCVALYEALYQQHPFAGDSPLELAAAVLAGRVVPPPAGSVVPARIGAAIQRGLARDPERRWPSLETLLDALEQHPRRLKRPALAVVLMLVTLGGLAALPLVRDDDDDCGEQADRLVELWNESRAGSIAAAFSASGAAWANASASRTDALLDAWAEHHRLARARACAADEAPPADQRAAIDGCLARGLDQLEELLERWTLPDGPALRTAIHAARELPDPARCTELESLAHGTDAGDDPELQRQLERGLARGHALFDSGARQPARTVAEQTLALANNRHIGTQAEARALLGRIAAAARELGTAQRELELAYFGAIAAGRDELATAVACELVALVGLGRLESARALDWAEHADALAARLDAPLWRGRVAHLRGLVHARFERHSEAMAQLEQAHELLALARGAEDLETADVLADLALTEARVRFAPAPEQSARALAIAEVALGPGHPELARFRSRHGMVGWLTGDVAAAEIELEQAGRELERDYGNDDPELAAVALALAEIALERDDLTTADAQFERAHAVLERRHGASHRALAPALAGLAIVAVARGDDPRVAIELGERAVATLGALPVDRSADPTLVEGGSVELARAQATLAMALHARDPDDPRALELARTARRRLLETGASAWIITRTAEIIAAHVGSVDPPPTRSPSVRPTQPPTRP